MRQVAAVFDFDKTVTFRDSLNDLLIYQFGFAHFIKTMVTSSRILLSISKNDNTGIKNSMLRAFFAGMRKEEFERICQNYAHCRLPEIIRSEAAERICWHQGQGHTVIVVTASCEEWIRPWARQNGVDKILASKIQYKEGILTGKLEGKSCYGQTKVDRLREMFPDRHNYRIYAYGDSKGDKKMLEFADYGYYRCFH